MSKVIDGGTTRQTNAAGPARRIIGVDAARALAIIGMLAINVGPTDSEGVGGWLYTLPHGRASMLFVLLAGVGVSLMAARGGTGTAVGPRVPWITLLWRGALLLVGGLALQLLDHDVNVILPAYALLFLIAGAAARATDRTLLVAAALVATAGPVAWLIAQSRHGGTVPRPDLLDPPGRVVEALVLLGPYPVVTWSAPFLVGMWLGRRHLGEPSVQRRMVGVGAVVAMAVTALSAVMTRATGGPVADLDGRLLLTSGPHGQMPLWLLGGTASAVLALGVCLVVCRDAPGWTWPLVAAGQLSLTIYVGHLLVLHVVRPLPHDLTQGVLITLALVLVALVGATVWRHVFRCGPLEWLLRAPRFPSSAPPAAPVPPPDASAPRG